MYDVSRDVEELLNDPISTEENNVLSVEPEVDSSEQTDGIESVPPGGNSDSFIDKVRCFVKRFINIIAFAVATFVALALTLVIFADDLFVYLHSWNLDSPKERFVYAQMQSAENFADRAASLYGKWYRRVCTDTSAYDVELHLLFSDQVTDKINNYLPEERRGDFSWVDDLSLHMNINRDRYIYEINADSKLKNHKLFSINSMMDTSDGLLLLQLPELSDSYLNVNLLTDNQELFGKYLHAIDKDSYTQCMAALPSEQVFNELLLKYLSLLINEIHDVEQEKTTLSLDDISVDCTALTATITEEQLIDIYINLLETVRQDTLILGLVEDVAQANDLDPKSEREKFIHSITEYIRHLQDATEKASENNYIKWTIYVDGQNNILGRSMIVSGVESKYVFYTLSDGDKFIYYFNLFDTVCVSGGGVRYQTWMDMDFDVYLDGVQSFHVQVDDLHLLKYINGNITASILIEPTEQVIQQWYDNAYTSKLVYSIDINTTRQGADVHLDIIKDDSVIVGLSYQGTEVEGKEIAPLDSAMSVNNHDELTKWLENLQFDKLKNNLTRANLPPVLTDELELYLIEILEYLEK